MQNLQKKNLWKQCLSIALCFTLVFSSFLLTGSAFAEEGDPTLAPAETALSTPTAEPTATATDTPTTEPTATATDAPTAEPTATATGAPTAEPTATATDAPTEEPTATATDAPTAEPTATATGAPTAEPTATATDAPAAEPTATAAVLPKLALQAPTMGLATVISSSQLKITWNQITNAQWYEISRSGTANGTYTIIGQSSSTAFTDSSCLFGVVNYYKVRACAYEGNVNVYSDWSVYRSCFGLSTPGLANMESVDVTGVRFTWHSVANATGYYLSRSTSPNGPFTRFRTVNGGATTTAIQYGITTGQKYYYRVQAWSKPGAVTYVGPLSIAMPFTRTPVKATLTSVTPLSNTTASLDWNQVPGAVGYAVFRSNALDGSYYRIATITGGNTLSATVGAINGSMNYYKVCGYVYYGNMQVLGTLSDALGAFPMAAPTVTKAIYSSTISAYLLWNGVNGATGYNIYRSNVAAGPYVKVADTALNWYTDMTLTNNVCYYYRVTALRLQDSILYESPMSAIVPVTVVNATMQSYTCNANQSVTLYWVKNAGGLGGFEVSRSLYANYGYTVICNDDIGNFTYNGTQYSYTDPSPYVGMVNYYRVRCFRYNGAAKVYSAYSNTLSTLSIATSRVNAFTTGDGYVTLSYQAVSLATQYRIYRGTSSAGPFALVGTSTGLTFRDNGITPGIVYYYRIAAFVGGLIGPLSDPQPYVSLTQPTVDAISDTVVPHPIINWDVIPGATNYRIFRSTSVAGTYSYISWIPNGSTNTFTDSTVDASTPYYYKVQPVYFVTGGPNSNGPMSAAKVFLCLGKPTLSSCKPYSADTNYLVWTAVSGADGYEISRSTSPSGIFASIANVENATVYINSGLPAGTYYYRVRAYKIISGYKQYSHYSDTEMARVLSAPSITGYYAYASQNDVRLGWSVVSNAEGYAVYYAKSNNANYILAGYVTDGALKAYTVTGLLANTTYYFKVAAYQFTDGGATRIIGATSSEVACVTGARTSVSGLCTPNPYTYAQNGQSWTYSIPGAYRLLITFSDDTNFADSNDYIEIFNKNSSMVGHYTGNALGGATVEVIGDSFTITMACDQTLFARGFKVTSVSAHVNSD